MESCVEIVMSGHTVAVGCKNNASRCRRKWSYHQIRIQWELLKAFCLKASAHHASRCVGIAYKTAYRRYQQFRTWIKEIAAKERRQLLGEIELDENYFGGRRKDNRGRGAGGKVAVFGLLESRGKVCTVVVEDVSKETLMEKIRAKSLKGSVYYTDQFRSYLGVKSYGKHLSINHQKVFVKGHHHINGIKGFLAFAKQYYLH